MNRRDLLKNAASASMLAFGATTAASATNTPTIDDVSRVSMLNEQGERVTMSIEEADVDPTACCFSDTGCDDCPPGCRCCVC